MHSYIPSGYKERPLFSKMRSISVEKARSSAQLVEIPPEQTFAGEKGSVVSEESAVFRYDGAAHCAFTQHRREFYTCLFKLIYQN